MKIKHTRTHFYTAGPILFLHDDAMNLNAKTYNIEFSALSFPYFKIPPTYTRVHRGANLSWIFFRERSSMKLLYMINQIFCKLHAKLNFGIFCYSLR